MEVGRHAGPRLHYSYPFLPCQLLLPCAVGYGTQISIQGTVPAGASRFSVNFKKSVPPEEAPTVVFHFNPRFSEGPVVVRNSRVEGSWAEEERALDSKELPFAHQKDFCMVFAPDETGWNVVLDGSHLLTFNHRLPIEDVTHLCIKGDVMISSIDLPCTKFLAKLPGRLRPEDLIIIKGEIPSGASRFMANLQTGPSVENDDLCLHINPRFDQSTVICNTRLNQTWGSEETFGGTFPLTQGSNFVLLIGIHSEFYKIWINGKHLFDYNHRCSLDMVTDLLIDGDVTVSDVYIESQPNFLCSHFEARTITDIKMQTLLPEVPSCIALPDGLAPGQSLILTGLPSEQAQRFAVNLESSEGDGGNVVLHFNARWDDGPSIVLNSRRDGNWNTETVLSFPAFPFVIAKPFRLVIHCRDDHHYVIALDDVILTNEFHSHLCSSDIKAVRLIGQFCVGRVIVC